MVVNKWFFTCNRGRAKNFLTIMNRKTTLKSISAAALCALIAGQAFASGAVDTTKLKQISPENLCLDGGDGFVPLIIMVTTCLSSAAIAAFLARTVYLFRRKNFPGRTLRPARFVAAAVAGQLAVLSLMFLSGVILSHSSCLSAISTIMVDVGTAAGWGIPFWVLISPLVFFRYRRAMRLQGKAAEKSVRNNFIVIGVLGALSIAQLSSAWWYAHHPSGMAPINIQELQIDRPEPAPFGQ